MLCDKLPSRNIVDICTLVFNQNGHYFWDGVLSRNLRAVCTLTFSQNVLNIFGKSAVLFRNINQVCTWICIQNEYYILGPNDALQPFAFVCRRELREGCCTFCWPKHLPLLTDARMGGGIVRILMHGRGRMTMYRPSYMKSPFLSKMTVLGVGYY